MKVADMHDRMAYATVALLLSCVIGVPPSAAAGDGETSAVVVSEETLMDGDWAKVAKVLPETAKDYIPPDENAFAPPVREIRSHDIRITEIETRRPTGNSTGGAENWCVVC